MDPDIDKADALMMARGLGRLHHGTENCDALEVVGSPIDSNARVSGSRGREVNALRRLYHSGVLEIALTVGGLMLAVLAYFVGVRRGKQYRAEDRAVAAEHDADHRIDRVVQRYALLVRTSQTGALHGLLVAGVKNLRSEEEVRLARERATAHTGIDPLRPYLLDHVNLKEFVDACEFDDASITNHQALLTRYGKRRDA